MALSKESVKASIKILKKISSARTLKLEHYVKGEDDIFSTNYIYCIGEMSDGGFEEVFTNIEDITPDQMELWERLKDEVPNSSMTNKLEEDDYPYFWKKEKKTNITRIGWF